jgi:hypothetical protein
MNKSYVFIIILYVVVWLVRTIAKRRKIKPPVVTNTTEYEDDEDENDELPVVQAVETVERSGVSPFPPKLDRPFNTPAKEPASAASRPAPSTAAPPVLPPELQGEYSFQSASAKGNISARADIPVLQKAAVLSSMQQAVLWSEILGKPKALADF